MSYARTIKEYIKHNCIITPDEDTAIFLDKFHEIFKEHLLCIILYGSCLHSSTRKATSIHDFYIVVDSYYGILPGVLHTVLNILFPPNVYYIQLDKGDNIIEAKYNTIIGCIYNAMMTNAWFTLACMQDEFTLEGFIKNLLKLSYSGEVRIERDTKIDDLFNAGKEFYEFVYGRILDEISVHIKTVEKKSSFYRLVMTPEENNNHKKWLDGFIKKSRRRSIMRWPKSIYTFGNYVDYLLLKVERSKGIKIELTPMERKFPLIFGWRHFFKLRRKGMIK